MTHLEPASPRRFGPLARNALESVASSERGRMTMQRWLTALAMAGALRADGALPPQTSPDFAVGVQVPPVSAPGTGDALALVPRESAVPAAGTPPGDALLGPDQWQDIPDLLTDHLALDWGVAKIAGPVVYLGNAAVGGSGGRSPVKRGRK